MRGHPAQADGPIKGPNQSRHNALRCIHEARELRDFVVRARAREKSNHGTEDINNGEPRNKIVHSDRENPIRQYYTHPLILSVTKALDNTPRGELAPTL